MININEHGVKKVTGPMWRLVSWHTGFITLIDGDDRSITGTIQDVEEFVTEKAAMDKMDTEGWDINDRNLD